MGQDLSFTANRRTVSRRFGGVAAMSYPILLIALALGTGFRKTGDYADLAASFLAALLLLIAEPTAWLFAFDFVDPDRFTILFVGALTSLPLWYLVGSAVAARSERWVVFVRRYTLVCVGWTLFNIVMFITIAWLFG